MHEEERYKLYQYAFEKIGNKIEQRNSLFKELLSISIDKECLQVGVRGSKYAPHWVSVDLYDQSAYIDYNYDIHNLGFSDAAFDVIVCNAVLEHVEDPVKAIKELYRVLKPDGLIWIEVPLGQPYHPSPGDFWRVTPEGMSIWMQDFIKLELGLFGSPIYNGIFFYGKKQR